MFWGLRLGVVLTVLVGSLEELASWSGVLAKIENDGKINEEIKKQLEEIRDSRDRQKGKCARCCFQGRGPTFAG